MNEITTYEELMKVFSEGKEVRDVDGKACWHENGSFYCNTAGELGVYPIKMTVIKLPATVIEDEPEVWVEYERWTISSEGYYYRLVCKLIKESAEIILDGDILTGRKFHIVDGVPVLIEGE